MNDTPLPLESTEAPTLEGIILTPEDPGALVIVSRPDPVAIFTNPQLVDAILARVAELAMDFTPNLTTKAGRAEIAGRARRVASTKVYLDDLGKDEVARLKDLPRAIDAGRKTLRDGFDAIKDRVRQPLDAWEAEDAAQQARLAGILALPRDLATAPAALIEGQIVSLELVSTDEATFGPYVEEARAAVAQTIEALTAMRDAAHKREQEALELERLRREAAERAQRDREEQIRREAEEKAKKEAAEQARAREEAAKRREAEAKLEAEQAEQRAKDAEARAEQERRDADRRAQEAAEAATAAERRRAEQEAAQAADKARQVAEEEKARAQDVEHRREFNREALADILTTLDAYHRETPQAAITPEGEAKAVLAAIVTGKVRHIQIVY